MSKISGDITFIKVVRKNTDSFKYKTVVGKLKPTEIQLDCMGAILNALNFPPINPKKIKGIFCIGGNGVYVKYYGSSMKEAGHVARNILH